MQLSDDWHACFVPQFSRTLIITKALVFKDGMESSAVLLRSMERKGGTEMEMRTEFRERVFGIRTDSPGLVF